MQKQILVTVALLISGFISCKQVQQKELDLREIRKIIESSNKIWCTAIENNNIEELLSLYTEDAILLPPNKPMLRGKQQIRAYYELISKRDIKIIKPSLTIYDISSKDSTAYEIGQYIINIEKQNKFLLSDTGKYTTIWKLQKEGTWKIHADCWNSNNPIRLVTSNRQSK